MAGNRGPKTVDRDIQKDREAGLKGSASVRPPTFRRSAGHWLHALERLYPYLPVWIQNVGISIYGLAYRHERLGPEFDAYVSGFRERERWPADLMQSFLEEKMRRVLVHAFENVSYYRRVWGALGVTSADLAAFRLPDLASLPITAKDHLRSNPADFVAVDVARHRHMHRYYTSGSTGTPITCYLTSEGHRKFVAAREARSFGWAGVSIRWPRSMIGGRLVAPFADSGPPYYRYNWAERQVYFSAYHISPRNVANYVEGFHHCRPRVLTGYAYSHYALARMMLQYGFRLAYKPDALILSSEKLTPDMKAVIQEAFQARPYEEYGAVEQCVLATECESGNLHVSSDFGIVEILDIQGRPVPPGHDGRIICTGLLNEAQPLIRYDIGDVAAWSTESCSCGRNHLPVLKEIVGRLEDTVTCPDGREVVRFHGLFIGVPYLLEAQVIQEKIDLLRVKVVVTCEFSEKEERLIRERVTAQRLGRIRVEIERVDRLERTERGKFRAVVSRVPRQNRDLANLPVR